MNNTNAVDSFGSRQEVDMVNITNKEKEECQVWVIDYRGYIFYEAQLRPDEDLELDLKELAFGIYKMIFKTAHTSYIQEFVKY